MSFRYAGQITRDCNAKSRSFVFYVTWFAVEDGYVSRCDGRMGVIRSTWSEAYPGVPLTMKA